MLLSIVIVLLLAVSAVSAADNETSDIVAVEETTENAINIEETENFATIEENNDMFNENAQLTLKEGDVKESINEEGLLTSVHVLDGNSDYYDIYGSGNIDFKIKVPQSFTQYELEIYSYDSDRDMNSVYGTSDGDGFVTFKTSLKPGSYGFSVYDFDYGSTQYYRVYINAFYGTLGYKNVKITNVEAYYCQDKDLKYEWEGLLIGYFKLYKGSKLITSIKLNNRDDDYCKFYYDEYNVWVLDVGTYKAKIIDSKGNVVAQSTIKIKKAYTKIKVSSIKAKHKTKKYITAKVCYKHNGEEHWGGKVKFKINGKTYKVKVKEGIAKLKIKIPSKAKTYKCKVTFLGDKSSKRSSAKFKIKVLGSHNNKKVNNRKQSSSKYKIITTKAKYHWITKKSGHFTVKTIIWDMTAGFRAPGKYIDTTLYKNGRQVYNSKYSVKYKINGRWTGWTKYGTTSTAHHRYFVWDSDYVGKIKVKVKRNVNSYMY